MMFVIPVVVALSSVALRLPDKPTFTTTDSIREMVREIDPSRVQAAVLKLVGFGTRNTMSRTDSDTEGIGAARKWIKAEFDRISAESGGRLKVELDGYRQEPDGNRIVQPTEIVNVVATLPGVQPESAGRIYLMCAHYDSMASDPKDFTSAAPGANDNATGVAALIEAARAMAKQEFEATIQFVAFAGEEQGLLGSKHMATRAREAGVHIAGVLNNDIIGATFAPDGQLRMEYVRVFSEGVPLADNPEDAALRALAGGENDSPSRQLARYIDEAAGVYVTPLDTMLMFRVDRLMRGGDHISFNRAGYPAVRFTEAIENHNFQHQDVRVENGFQYGDLPKHLHFDYTANVARMNVAAIASLARAPARPRNVRLVLEKASKDTTLRWDANTEPDLAGYMIVWRETSAVQWKYGTLVAATTEHTVPFSKDDYLFGLCALDRDNHVSEATFARPTKQP